MSPPPAILIMPSDSAPQSNPAPQSGQSCLRWTSLNRSCWGPEKITVRPTEQIRPRTRMLSLDRRGWGQLEIDGWIRMPRLDADWASQLLAGRAPDGEPLPHLA